MKLWIRALYLVCVVFFFSLTTTLSSTHAQDPIEIIEVVTAQRDANVRQTPSSSATLVGTLPAGETAVVLEIDLNGELVQGTRQWYKIRLTNGVEGWVWGGAVTYRKSFSEIPALAIPQDELRVNFPDYIISDRQQIHEADVATITPIDWERAALLKDNNGEPMPLGFYLASPPIDPEVQLFDEVIYAAGIISDIYFNADTDGHVLNYIVAIAVPLQSPARWQIMTAYISSSFWRVITFDDTGNRIGLAPASGNVTSLSTVVDSPTIAGDMVYYTATNTFSIPTAAGVSTLAVGDPALVSIVLDTTGPFADSYNTWSDNRDPYTWLGDLIDDDPQNDGNVIFTHAQTFLPFVAPDTRAIFPIREPVLDAPVYPDLSRDVPGDSLVVLDTLLADFPSQVTANDLVGGSPSTIRVNGDNLARLRDYQGNPLQFGVYQEQVPLDPDANPWRYNGNTAYFAGVVVSISENVYGLGNYIVAIAVPIERTRQWKIIYVMIYQNIIGNGRVLISALDGEGQAVGFPASNTYPPLWPIVTGESGADLEATIIFNEGARTLRFPVAGGRSVIRAGDPIIVNVFPSLPGNFQRDREFVDQFNDLVAGTIPSDEEVLIVPAYLATPLDTVPR